MFMNEIKGIHTSKYILQFLDNQVLVAREWQLFYASRMVLIFTAMVQLLTNDDNIFRIKNFRPVFIQMRCVI